MLFLAAVLALLIGVTLGLLGGGGSILTLPVLVYVLDVEPKRAIATSLLVVGVTSASALAAHARAGRVRWRIGAFFGAAGMVGAYLGGALGRLVPAQVLLGAFGLVMLAASLAMMRGRPPMRDATPPVQIAAGRILAMGLVVGIVAGLLGAGGGFLIVPALVMLAGLTMPEAVGTSLFVIVLQSFAGLAGNLGHVRLDWRVAIGVTVAAVIGSVAGARLAGVVSAVALRRVFAWFVLAVGVFVVVKQLWS